MPEVKISRGDKNVYEKFDMDNWMCLPKYDPNDATTYFDVGNLVYCRSEMSQLTDEELKNLDVKEIFSTMLENKQRNGGTLDKCWKIMYIIFSNVNCLKKVTHSEMNSPSG